MYFVRHAEKTLTESAKYFPAVLVTGARQVGKSTLLQHKLKTFKYITMDDDVALDAIRDDAYGFLTAQGTPAIYDEVQRAADSFNVVKRIIDTNKQPGMFFFSGSQKFALMQGLSESLAGRIGIVELLGLSNREIWKDNFSVPFLPTKNYLSLRKTKIKMDNSQLWRCVQRGSYPELWEKKDFPADKFYNAYLQTYLERDVRQLSQVGDLRSFRRFMGILAGRIGGLFNLTSAARDAEIDVKTAKRWVSVLEASNLIYLLQPFSTNAAKRVIKTPKLYFYDTGLVCYLTKWTSPETAEAGAQAGALFENFVLMEIVKSYTNAGQEAPVYYFREAGGREIDLLLYQNNTLYPIEIKKTASPNVKDIKNFQIIGEYFSDVQIGAGGVVCNYDKVLALNEQNSVIPLAYI